MSRLSSTTSTVYWLSSQSQSVSACSSAGSTGMLSIVFSVSLFSHTLLMGISMLNVVPSPTLLLTLILPCTESTTFFTSARPTPVPMFLASLSPW